MLNIISISRPLSRFRRKKPLLRKFSKMLKKNWRPNLRAFRLPRKNSRAIKMT